MQRYGRVRVQEAYSSYEYDACPSSSVLGSFCRMSRVTCWKLPVTDVNSASTQDSRLTSEYRIGIFFTRDVLDACSRDAWTAAKTKMFFFFAHLLLKFEIGVGSMAAMLLMRCVGWWRQTPKKKRFRP